MNFFFTNLSIRTKIITGFLAVSVSLILFSAVSYLFITDGKESVENYNKCLNRYETIYNIRIKISDEISLFHEIATAGSKFEADSLFNLCELNFRFFEKELQHVDNFLAEHAKNKFNELNTARSQIEIIKKFHYEILVPAIKSSWYLRTRFLDEKQKAVDAFNPDDMFLITYKSLNRRIEQGNSEVQHILDKFNEHAGEKIVKATQASDNRYVIAEYFYGFLIFFGIILILITLPVANYFIKPFYKLRDYIALLGKGVLPDDKLSVSTKDEIGELASTLSLLADGLKAKASFAQQIQNGDFNHDFQLLSKDDMLGHSLLEMSESLNKASIAEKSRQVDETRRAWSTQGLAKFADIMRKSRENLNELSDEIIKELVLYMNANQGGLFLYNDDSPADIHLDLIACYAYNRKKYAEKVIRLKEGLVGTCAIEKETIYLTNIPDNYIQITSGLGDANPNSLILVPLKLEESIFGVIEIASFNELLQHEIQFLERIAESIASTLSSVKISQKTQELLTHSQQQAALLTEQEEELRQNLEEMRATQDEMIRKEAEMTGQLGAINSTNAMAEYDMDGKILKANEILCSLLKYKPIQLIGRKINILLGGDAHDKHGSLSFWDNLCNNEPFEGEYVRMSSEGESVFFKGSYFPITDAGGIPYKVVELAVDITDQKKLLQEAQQITEEMKSQQEELHRRDIEMNEQLTAINNTLAMLEYDINGNIIGANNIFCKLFGYAAGELTGKHHSIFFDNKNLKNSTGYKKFWEGMHAGNHYQGEMKRITKDGAEIIIIGSSHPFFDSNNHLYKVMEFTLDITEQKQLLQQSQQKTEELKSQEEELKQNLEEMHTTQEELKRKELEMTSQLEAIDKTLAVLEYSPDGIILKANAIFCNILGYSEKELIGKHHSLVIEDKNLDSPAYRQFWETLRSGQHVQGEKKRIAKSGKLKTVVRSSFPFLDMNREIIKVLEAFIDVTQQKELIMESQIQRENQMKIELETRALYEKEINEMFTLWYNQLTQVETVYLMNNK